MGEQLLNHFILALGSVCTFTYLAYVYLKSRSIFVTALANIVLNNAAASFSYFVIVQNQLLANLGLTLTMVSVVVFLYLRREVVVFRENPSPQIVHFINRRDLSMTRYAFCTEHLFTGHTTTVSPRDIPPNKPGQPLPTAWPGC
ncbi:MAG: hypothetical protein ACUVWA_14385 [Candidatus Oleimicrobiaceae bacterium]